MGRGNRRRGKELEREVAIRDGIDRVRHGRIEAERRGGAARSIGKLVPASAAAPSGHSLSRARASAKRPRSRPNISTYAIR